VSDGVRSVGDSFISEQMDPSTALLRPLVSVF